MNIKKLFNYYPLVLLATLTPAGPFTKISYQLFS